MELNLAVLPGDGIGPDVVAEGLRVLQAVCKRYGHTAHLTYRKVGGASIDEFGEPLPAEVLEMCRQQDAVFFGAVGGPKWDDPRSKLDPQQGILGLRRGLDLFANLRPVKVYAMLIDSSPVKPEVLQGTDLVIVRELTGGLYFGRPRRRWTTSRGRRAVDTMRYTEQEIRRLLKVGFDLARTRRRKLCCVDKHNVLETSRLWFEIAEEVAQEYPEVQLEHLLVDNFAMSLIRRPSTFDVVVTENTFGDILTDEAAVLAGSLGMMPSASLGTKKTRKGTFGLYEPIHGSAPDIAGQNKANPIATILSAAMMLRYSFGLEREAQAVEGAILQALTEGYRTADIFQPGTRLVSTTQMGEAIANYT